METEEEHSVVRLSEQWAVRLVRSVFAAIAVAAPCFFVICFRFQPDNFAAVTIIPAWAWLCLGVCMVRLFSLLLSKRVRTATLLLWMLFLVGFVDESSSLLRHRHLSELSLQERRQAGIIRIVSLNCAGGSDLAAYEALAYHPDVILLQESPSRTGVCDLARQLGGAKAEFLYGVDTSVVTIGKVTPIHLDSCSSVCRISLPGMADLSVASTRLLTPSFRTDLWKRDCWRDYRELRLIHRMTLTKLMSEIPDDRTPVLIGGDFNLPANDGAVNVLRPRLRDAFNEAGSGWCNTIINDFPFHRIDQMWISRELHAIALVARKTVNSDHRMVICDLILPGQNGGEP